VWRYYELFPKRFKDPERHSGDRNIYSYGAQLYVTNMKNTMWTNFEARVKTYLPRLQTLEGMSDALYREMLFDVMGWQFNLGGIRAASAASDDTSNQRTVARAAVREIHRILGIRPPPHPAFTITDRWLKSTSTITSILRLYVHFNRFYQQNDLKMFNIVPICDDRSHHITIDWPVLCGILQEAGLVDGDTNVDLLEPLRREIWQSVFHIEHILADAGENAGVGASADLPRKMFSGILQTDGTSICTHLWREKKVAVQQTLDDAADVSSRHPGDASSGGPSAPVPMPATPSQTRAMKIKDTANLVPVDPRVYRVLAVDPGNSNIYTVIEVWWDKSGRRHIKSYKFTRGRYYHDAGIDKAREAAERWAKGIQESLKALSLASPKGVSVDAHDAYEDVIEVHGEASRAEYMSQRWARQRLSLYGGKKRALDLFFNEIEEYAKKRGDTRPVKLLYGSAKFCANVHGAAPTPTTSAYRAMVVRFPDVNNIPEFRTTRVHAGTDTLLKGIAVRQPHEPSDLDDWKAFKRKRLDPKERWKALVTLRSLLWCGSTIDKRGKFVDRDVNAAINIWRCGTSDVRPPALCRVPNQRLPHLTPEKLILQT